MLAVTSPSSTFPYPSTNNHANLHQYVSAQIRQLSPDRSAKASMGGKTYLRHDSAQPVEPSQTSQRPIRRVATEAPGRSTPNGVSATDRDDIRVTVNGDHRSTKPGPLVRSNTDLAPRRADLPNRPEPAEDRWELRHGWDEQYNSAEYLGQLRAVSAIPILSICCGKRRGEIGAADSECGRGGTCTTWTSGTKQGASLDRKTQVTIPLNGACGTV